MKKKDYDNHQHNAVPEDEYGQPDTITLELVDGTKQEFIVLDTLEHDNKHYVALAPLEGNEYYVYGFEEVDEHIEFFSIEDEQEFETVADIFERRFAEEDDLDLM